MYFIQKIILLFNVISLFETVIGSSSLSSNGISLPLHRVSTKNRHHLLKKRGDDSILGGIFGDGGILNGGSSSSDNNNSDSSSSPATVELLNDVEIHQYGIKIQVGTPSQEFLLLLDTGSSDTWIPSIKCQTANGCVSNRKYNADTSSTYQSRTEKVNITYAIGNAVGDYFIDRLQLNNDSQLAIKDQTLARIDNNNGPIATQGHPSKDSTIIDGVFGAGFPDGTLLSLDSDYKKTYTPFIMNLYNQSLIKEPIFSLSMDPDSVNNEDSEWLGEIVLGGINNKKFQDPIQYTPVTPRSNGDYTHWLVNLLGFRIEGNQSDFTNYRFVQPTRFFVDSGSNFMYLPQELADTLAKKITNKDVNKNNSVYFVDCELMNNQNDTPAFHVMFPTEKNATVGFPMTVPISKLIGQVGDQCFLLFMPTPPGTAFTLGNYWLRHFVSVFDFGKKRVGFSRYNTSSTN